MTTQLHPCPACEKIWVIKTPGGESIEYDDPGLNYTEECTVTPYVTEASSQKRIAELERENGVMRDALGEVIRSGVNTSPAHGYLAILAGKALSEAGGHLR